MNTKKTNKFRSSRERNCRRAAPRRRFALARSLARLPQIDKAAGSRSPNFVVKAPINTQTALDRNHSSLKSHRFFTRSFGYLFLFLYSFSLLLIRMLGEPSPVGIRFAVRHNRQFRAAGECRLGDTHSSLKTTERNSLLVNVLFSLFFSMFCFVFLSETKPLFQRKKKQRRLPTGRRALTCYNAGNPSSRHFGRCDTATMSS